MNNLDKFLSTLYAIAPFTPAKTIAGTVIDWYRKHLEPKEKTYVELLIMAIKFQSPPMLNTAQIYASENFTEERSVQLFNLAGYLMNSDDIQWLDSIIPKSSSVNSL